MEAAALVLKNEDNLRICWREEEAQTQPIRRVKRRRRDPAAAADQTNKQQSPKQHSDQAPTTTMKRSSRFRGVSR